MNTKTASNSSNPEDFGGQTLPTAVSFGLLELPPDGGLSRFLPSPVRQRDREYTPLRTRAFEGVEVDGKRDSKRRTVTEWRRAPEGALEAPIDQADRSERIHFQRQMRSARPAESGVNGETEEVASRACSPRRPLARVQPISRTDPSAQAPMASRLTTAISATRANDPKTVPSMP
jgi:hypothetical protein